MELPWLSMEDEPNDDEWVVIAFEDTDGSISYVAAKYHQSIHHGWEGSFFDWNGNSLEDVYFNGGLKMIGWQSFAPLVKGN